MPVDEDALNSLRIERSSQGARPPRSRRLLAFVAGGVIVVAALAFWLLRSSRALEVETATAQEASGSASAAVLDASGYVVARRLATVSSKVTGKVVEVNVEEGMLVKDGQVLARLDDSLARAQVEVAARQLDAARNDYAEVKVRLTDANRTLERRRTLRASNLVSQNDLHAAQAESEAQTARLAAPASQAEVGQANLKLARVKLRRLIGA